MQLIFADLPTEDVSKKVESSPYPHGRANDDNYILGLAISFLVLFALPLLVSGNIIAGLVLTLFGLILLAGYWQMRSMYSAWKKYGESANKFASTNGLRSGPSWDTTNDYRTFIQELGTEQYRQFNFSGVMGSYPFEVFLHSNLIYGNRKRKDWLNHTVFHIKLSKELPHIVLDSRKNDAMVSSIPALINDSQRVVLEGDFNEKFDLFGPNGYEIETLDILSPDFMQMLMDFHDSYDIDINKTDVYIIARGIRYDQESMQEMFKAAVVLMQKFDTKLRSWNMAVMQKQLPQLEYKLGLSALRVGGRRFSSVYLALLIGLFSFMCMVGFQVLLSSARGGGVIDAGVILAIIVGIVSFIPILVTVIGINIQKSKKK